MVEVVLNVEPWSTANPTELAAYVACVSGKFDASVLRPKDAAPQLREAVALVSPDHQPNVWYSWPAAVGSMIFAFMSAVGKFSFSLWPRSSNERRVPSCTLILTAVDSETGVPNLPGFAMMTAETA